MQENKSTMTKVKIWHLCAVPIVMFGFAFALVPLYQVFCDLTGLNGKPELSAKSYVSALRSDRTIKLQLISNAQALDQYGFMPITPDLRVTLGQNYRTAFKLHNPTAQTLTFQAVPSVSPGIAAEYLAKMECFCFTRQVIKPGETVEMPLVFSVHTNLPDDIVQMTLSYSLYLQNS